MELGTAAPDRMGNGTRLLRQMYFVVQVSCEAKGLDPRCTLEDLKTGGECA